MGNFFEEIKRRREFIENFFLEKFFSKRKILNKIFLNFGEWKNRQCFSGMFENWEKKPRILEPFCEYGDRLFNRKTIYGWKDGSKITIE